MSTPTPLWTPSSERQRNSLLQAFLDRHDVASYDEAWGWSTNPRTVGDFWRAVADDFNVLWHDEPERSLEVDPSRVPGVRWFPGATLNYAELALRDRESERTALLAYDDLRGETSLSWRELRELVGRLQKGLRDRGVSRGDVVAAFMPNVPETLALMLATTALGAIWTCCAPETGVQGVLDRFGQTHPVVFVAVDGYRYGTKVHDTRENASLIAHGLRGLRHSIMFDLLSLEPPAGWESWSDLSDVPSDVVFEAVSFDHPLYILYSSGTTGKPKAIVHGHGGIALEHIKALSLHFDLGEEDRFFWYTTTGWMMWNFCVSGLLVGATVTLYDGNPAWPTSERLWSFIGEHGVTCAGVGAAFVVACMKSGLEPGREFDLTKLKTLGATGSPLPPAAAEWVYSHVKPDLLLESFSGGTDVCTGFVGASPLHSVWAGEISCRCLGASVEVFDEQGRPLTNEEGELVVTVAMPSMPVGLLNDPDGDLYRATYFERFPGVWNHGDRATLTDRGTVIISGRSDGTLNRGGVRMGTAEFYAVVEGLDAVKDSLVVHLEDSGGGPGELWLFVVAPDIELEEFEQAARLAIRQQLSPRHVPDRIVCVDAVPRTLTGKKLEVPVKRILAGAAVDEVVSVSSLANPESLAPFVALGQGRAAGS